MSSPSKSTSGETHPAQAAIKRARVTEVVGDENPSKFGVERQSVTVSVPATSANMGTGYDCLGMAVDMWNELTVTRSDVFSMTAEGDGADVLPLNENNLVCLGVRRAFEAANKPLPPLKYHLKQGIPHARGLGSSSAAIVAGLLAGLCLAGHRLEVQGKEELLQLACSIEGHPDNVAPCMYGGVQLSFHSKHENRFKTERIPLPNDLVCVCFIPAPQPGGAGKKTEALRKVVPKEVSMSDAVHQTSHFGLLIHALLTNRIHNIREALEDRFHQKQRGDAVYTHLMPMIDAAYEAGAVGAWLSGAGPTVMTWVTGGSGDFFTQQPSMNRKDAQVAEALRRVAAKLGVEGNVYVTHVTHTGGCVVRADPPYSTPVLVYNGMT